jgi:hypothetical protein
MFTQLRVNHMLDTWTFVTWWACIILHILWGIPFCSSYSHESCMLRNLVSLVFMACCVCVYIYIYIHIHAWWWSS